MELSKAVEHILDGDAIIFMGAGASYGAKNPYGDFPSGSLLAEKLYEACKIVPDDKFDLQDAAQTYEEMFSANELIQIIRTQLTCASFLPCHTTVFCQPWRRYYTTNYDDVALLAAQENGVKITPVTLSSNYKKYSQIDRLCIHINGHINKLTESTLHTEFKLTTASYLAEESIRNSQWGALMSADLEAAQCIVILGLSMKYDLDLGRILYRPEIKDKTIIIDRPDLTQNSERRLARFGTVYKIGLQGLAEKIEEISLNYSPKAHNPEVEIYTSFEHDDGSKISVESATPNDVYRLFFAGTYEKSLFHVDDGYYRSIVYRSKSTTIHNAIQSGKKYIFVYSDMGNGKTTCLHELRAWLCRNNYNVFMLTDVNEASISKEVLLISSIDKPTVVIIDNYSSYMDVLNAFSLRNHDNIQFVFSARTAVNYSKRPDVIKLFSIEENESVSIELDHLNHADLNRCIDLFDRYGIWGLNANLSQKEKYLYLKSRDHGNSMFQSIMLDVMKSDELVRRIKEVVQTIQSSSETYYNAVILILITQIMNLRISTSDIEKIIGISIATDAKFIENLAIKEFLTVNAGGRSFAIKSPVTSKIILHKIARPKIIIELLKELALYAVNYCYVDKYYILLNDIISFSHISSFLRGYDNLKPFIANYYDQLSSIEYYQQRNFFWLQYAISCIEIEDFERAQRYLDNAYGLAPQDFVPFQINNQQARLYLKKIIKNRSKDPLSDFKKAHELLMLPIVSSKDNEVNVVILFNNYVKKDFMNKLVDRKMKEFYKVACKEAYNRITSFLSHHKEYASELSTLSRNLFKAAFE